MRNEPRALVVSTPAPSPHVDLAPSETPSVYRTLINEWLRSKRSVHTQIAYARDIAAFFIFIMAPEREIPRTSLDQVRLSDIQDYALQLEQSGWASSTQMRKMAAIKSLFTFLYRAGALPVNVAAAQPLPAIEDTLAERILSPAQIQNMLYEAKQNSSARNYTLLLLLYGSGCRCEEICNLQWRNVQAREESGQITVYGKGRKTRAIPLHQFVWDALMVYKPMGVAPEEYVFQSRQLTMHDGHLSRRLDEGQVWRIVKQIAAKAGIPAASTHWLRHAHATHAMDQGAPLRLIMAIMGHADLRTPAKYQHVRPDASTSYYLPF